METAEALVALTAIVSIFLGVPWLILHNMTKWKQAKSITLEDENLLDELYDIARRLDDRMNTIERIIAADQGVSPRITAMRDEIDNIKPLSRSSMRDQSR